MDIKKSFALHLVAMPFVFAPPFACFLSPEFKKVPIAICIFVMFIIFMNSMLSSIPKEKKEFKNNIIKFRR